VGITSVIAPLQECIGYAAVKQRRSDPRTSESSAQIGCDIIGALSASSESPGTHHSAEDKIISSASSVLSAVDCSKAFLSRDTVMSLSTTHIGYSRLVHAYYDSSKIWDA
jgi:hypothetical protein